MRRLHKNSRRLTFESLESREVLSTNPTATFVTNFGDIEFELLADVAPRTVANFVNYALDGDYDGGFFHRLVPGFVLQGGGFTTTEDFFCPSVGCSLDVIDTSTFASVPTDDPIVNEFGTPNTRGTVAMAKLGGDPDSATSQFFVNLSDNRSNLDNQNGGFTVFAQVNDLTLVDAIAELNQADLSSIFAGNSDPSLQAIGAAPFEITDDGYRLVIVEDVIVTGTVNGNVFYDADQDGVQDDSEFGRTGITVFEDTNGNGIADAGEQTAITDNEGNYTLSYQITEPRQVQVVAQLDAAWTANVNQFNATANPGQSFEASSTAFTLAEASWFNSSLAADVDGAAGVSPLDALQIINELNTRSVSDASSGALQAPSIPSDGTLFFPDTNNDGLLTPTDAIVVINFLNNANTPEAAASSAAASSAALSVEVDVPDEQEADEAAAVIDAVFAEDDI